MTLLCMLPHTILYLHFILQKGDSMNKIVTVTGHKNCGKDIVVKELTKNDGVVFIKPYTDRELPPHLVGDSFYEERYNYVLPSVMEDLLRDSQPLSEKLINGHRYVYFAFQMVNPVNVVIADDYEVVSIKETYPSVYSVRVVSEKEEQSDRVGEYLYQHEFDFVLDFDNEPVELVRDMVL